MNKRVPSVRDRWDSAFAIVLFLVLTQSYRVIAIAVGATEISVITAVVTVLCVAYLVFTNAKSRRVISSGYLFFFALVGWPLATLVYAPGGNYRDALLQVHYFLLVISSAQFFSSYARTHKLFLRAFIFSVGAMFVSIISPELFSSMASMASAPEEYGGRGFGLFLQPNDLANNLILFIVLLYLSMPARKKNAPVLIYLIFALALFLTGSRGGLLAGSVFLLGVWIVEKEYFKASTIVAGIGLSVLGALLGAGYSAFVHGGGIDMSLYQDRLMSILGGEISGDSSIEARLAYQVAFVREIQARPYLGHGIGSASYMLGETTRLIGSAHNQILDLLLHYGLFGLLLCMFCAYRLQADIREKFAHKPRGITILIFLTILIVMLGTNMLFLTQNFYIFLGFVLARQQGVRRVGLTHNSASSELQSGC